MRNALAILFLSMAIQAATIPAASTSYADVAAAVASASSGDTVTIPAGNSAWGSDKLRVTKAINLIGAGTNSTVISRNDEMIRYSVTTASLSNSLIRVSGITFSNTAASAPSLIFHGKAGGDDPGPGTPTSLNSVRVDNCLFYEGSRAIRLSGWVSGVIDHCDFTGTSGRNDVAIGYVGGNNDNWRFAGPFTPGTTNAIVIEDCRFFLKASYTGATTIYNEQGAVTTVRFCTFTGSTGDPSFVECHGNQNYADGDSGDIRSTIGVEMYGNTLTMSINNYRYINFRGGSILVYSNAFTDLSGGTPLIRLDEEEAHQTAFFTPLDTVWPAQDQITNSFFYANTLNGSAPSTLVDFADDVATEVGVFIQVNRDYWTAAPSGSNGSPAGIYEDYVPLTYPHPLVTYYDGGGGGESETGGQTRGVVMIRGQGVLR